MNILIKQKRHKHRPAPLSFVGLLSLYPSFLQLSGFQGTKGDTKSGGAMRGRTRRSPRSPFAFAIPEATATEVWLQKWTWLWNCSWIS